MHRDGKDYTLLQTVSGSATHLPRTPDLTTRVLAGENLLNIIGLCYLFFQFSSIRASSMKHAAPTNEKHRRDGIARIEFVMRSRGAR